MRTESSAVLWLAAWGLAALWAPRSALCQVITPGGPPRGPVVVSEADAPHTTSTRELVKRIQRARQLLTDENYAEGSRLLQTVLESDEDAFFYPDQGQGASERSLKIEAQSLLGQMPLAGRDQYEQQLGPAARRLLEAALRAHDSEALAFVARRYFHTQAGYEAAYHLAAEHFDHDRPLTAALGFERILAAPRTADPTSAAGRFEPYVSIKCAISWMRAGRADKARDVLIGLHGRSPRKTVTIGGHDPYAAAADEWAATQPEPVQVDDDELAAQRLYDLALEFQERSQRSEARLLEQFEDASSVLIGRIGDLIVNDDEDERLTLTASGEFRAEVLTEEENEWRPLKTAEELVEYYDPTDVFGDLADALAEAYPSIAPEIAAFEAGADGEAEDDEDDDEDDDDDEDEDEDEDDDEDEGEEASGEPEAVTPAPADAAKPTEGDAAK
jgi:hypothetical protein